jgi:hypothetical protein
VCNWITYRRLCAVLPNDVIVRLLRAPNADGLRPLECAANDGILGLAKAYLLTRGMYIIREEDRGLATYQWIDVTDYETFDAGNRKEWAPLFCLTLMDKDRLNYPTTAQLFADPVIRKWIKNKIKCGILPAAFYMVMRCFMVGIFIVIDSDIGDIGVNDNNILSSNASDSNIANVTNAISSVSCKSFQSVSLSPHVRFVLCVYLIMYATLVQVACLIESFTFHPRNLKLLKRSDHGKKDLFVNYSFYHIMHSLLTVLIAVRAMASLMGYTAQSDLVTYVRLVNRPLMWWSLLYFVQLLPGADFFVVAIQNVIGVLGQFSCMFLLFLFSFAQSFMIAININLKQGCVAQFTDLPNSIYSTFLVMLNMLDTTQYDVINTIALSSIQVMCVMIGGILLLNFLVAIMSDRITETSKFKDVILPVQKLSVVLTMERQLWPVNRFYYRWIQRKIFTLHNDRLCIVRFTVRSSKKFNSIGPEISGTI